MSVPCAGHNANTGGVSSPTPAEVSLAASRWSNLSWANTKDRSERTRPAREAMTQKWLDLADGDSKRAEHLRKAHYQAMALKSAQVRRANRDRRRGVA